MENISMRKSNVENQESIKDISEPDWDVNQVSPSDFNMLNQRFEEVSTIEKSNPKNKTIKSDF